MSEAAPLPEAHGEVTSTERVAELLQRALGADMKVETGDTMNSSDDLGASPPQQDVN